MPAQRGMGLAPGYEDVNDHDRLRDGSVLALAMGRDDLTGTDRRRKGGRGHPLAGSGTLNRLEPGTPDAAAEDRYRRTVADTSAIDGLMLDLFPEAHTGAPEETVLDMDATDDGLHGNREGRFFHGYYGHSCYPPPYVTCGGHALRARLRTADVDPAAGALEEMVGIVARIREAWPDTRIILRGDSGFRREPVMAWCGGNGPYYVFGLAGNRRPEPMIARQVKRSRQRCAATGKASRRFRSFRCRTRSGWSRSRRVVGKAEALPGRRGDTPGSWSPTCRGERFDAKSPYGGLHCARGDMENRIKQQRLELFADRTSTATMRANQLGLYLSAFAASLVRTVRAIGLRGKDMARARYATIRALPLKVACRVTVRVRRVHLSLPSAFARLEAFARAAAALRAARPPDGAAPAPS